jgi:hypothetical protein
MDTILTLDDRQHLRVERVRRDLRVELHDQDEVRLRSGSKATEVADLDGVIVIKSPDSLHLQIPPDCILEVGQVGGDLSFKGLERDCHISQIGGNARFENCAGLLVDRIGGDSLARFIRGGVSFKAVGGDVVFEGVTGQVKISGAGGDVILGQVDGEIQVAVGGEATISQKAGLKGPVDLSAGGDVYCRLPASASIAADLTAGGELKITGTNAPKVEWGQASFEVAGGDYKLSIEAGGDLWLAFGESAQAALQPEDIGATIAAKVGEKIAEMEAALTAMGAELDGVSSELISSRVQKIVNRAVRRQEQVEAGSSLREAYQQAMKRGSRASDQERMKVLKLLEEKKITIEQAEDLLEALES